MNLCRLPKFYLEQVSHYLQYVAKKISSLISPAWLDHAISQGLLHKLPAHFQPQLTLVANLNQTCRHMAEYTRHSVVDFEPRIQQLFEPLQLGFAQSVFQPMMPIEIVAVR